ncbi:PilN domain-containing protein [Thermodesulfobacterium hydrogeniphilum]|uniref:PilN domain-containing protein n=1 Tax=Thermodesulfobacterium hydrogeniphilum TaxID=161156 RepID=UPI00056E9DDA|nr:PilN domain-containing protein [Thermodesulfobacterium hydrogeniphilum]
MIIKFNLLPKKEEAFEEELKKEHIFLKVFIILIVLSFGFIIVETIKMSYEIKHLKKEKIEKEKKFKQYQLIDRQIKNLKIENEEIKRRIETIISLRRAQVEQLKKIETIIASINNNKVYLSQLVLNTNHAKIEGISFNLKEIANYLNNLEKQKPVIKEVNIEEIKRQNKYISFKTYVKF